jgi:DNA-directed RNA polymerase subunit RPC12/RpoP
MFLGRVLLILIGLVAGFFGGFIACVLIAWPLVMTGAPLITALLGAGAGNQLFDWQIGRYIKYRCTVCQEVLVSPKTDAGKSDSCPNCSAKFEVPGSSSSSQKSQNQLNKFLSQVKKRK